jgi:hypothetical protein
MAIAGVDVLAAGICVVVIEDCAVEAGKAAVSDETAAADAVSGFACGTAEGDAFVSGIIFPQKRQYFAMSLFSLPQEAHVMSGIVYASSPVYVIKHFFSD